MELEIVEKYDKLEKELQLSRYIYYTTMLPY